MSSSVRAWIVVPAMRRCTEISSSELLRDNARSVLRSMRALCPDTLVDVCTNECVIKYPEYGVKFCSGKFIDYAKG